MDRFLEAYIGSPYAGSSRVGGGLPFLGFVSLTGGARHERIGITAAGLEFARSTNPALDEREPTFPPFRLEEVGQIIAAIHARTPDEYAHMRHYIETVAAVENPSRDAVTARMRSFYIRYWNPFELTSGMIESLRATVHSRCQELGLVRTRREGRSSTYAVTSIGSHWLATGTLELEGGGSA